MRLGAYEVVSDLGAGGMGEVYRARDTTLRREVAVKVVHSELCDRPDSVARFRREARTLAALNHPNVAAIHEFDESGGVCFVVMELVPGDTLDAKLRQEPPSVIDALRLCSQIASALEAAHDKGIVHRDLKPANIKITPEGTAKVLDFGLAKALSPDDEPNPLSHAPTLTTGEGVILGTAAYMSPEQARGRAVDRRADIWAFGCVLFEALTSRRAFAGETVSDTIAGILEREPDWSLLPPETPPAIRRLLQRCLQKDPYRRLRDIGDARLEIDDAIALPEAVKASDDVASNRAARRSWLRAAAVLAIGAAAGAGVAVAVRPRPSESARPAAHFVIPLSAAEPLAATDFPAVAISPDGTQVAYVASRGGRTQLFLRPMNGLDASPIAGTIDAISPFFSPDSRWIAFFAQGKLKKVPLAGGPPVTICDADIGFGGSWGAANTIVFAATTGSPLSRVHADGGTPERATTLDAGRGEFSHRWPHVLPDGDTVVFTVGTLGSWDDAEIVAQSLKTGTRHVIVKGGTHPHYLPSGHLLYARGGTLMAVAFDATRLTATGGAVRVLDNVLEWFDGAAQVSVSRSGSAVYVPGNAQATARRLISVDSSGSVTPLAAPPRAYASPRLSPDGRMLLVTIAGTTEEIWLYDMSEASLKQITFEAHNSHPIWTPDGRRVTFSSTRSGALNLFTTRADESAAPERLTTSDNLQLPGSWSPDGAVLAFVEHHPTNGRDIWMLRYPGDRTPYPFVASPFDESAPSFSPDGRWVAYVSNESGRSEVYVRGFTDGSRAWQVSSEGGAEPVWSRDGRDLFYRVGNRLMAASVVGGVGSRTAPPRVIFTGTFESGTFDRANYDVTPSGPRFVMVAPSDAASSERELHIMLNWADGVPSLVARPR
jgi:serine/threonine-protein kinase